MCNAKRWFLVTAVALGMLMGMGAAVAGMAKQQGTYWYAVDNIRDAAEGARIVVWVTLPPVWQGQSVTVKNIYPKPAAVLEDPVSGNRVIEWVTAPPPRSDDPLIMPGHEFFHYEFELEEKPVRFQVDPAALGSYDKDTPLYRQYTAAETWIQTDGQIRDRARAIIGQERNPWLQGGLIYDWLLENLTFVPEGTEARDALSTLTGRAGDCSQYSVLFTALCRSIGIPSRTVTLTWLDGGGHVFSEVFIPGPGWIPVDVSLGQMLLPDGGGMSQEEVEAFMKSRDVPLGDPRWFYGNLPSGRMVTTVGNNIQFSSPTLGKNLSFRRLQPGGADATPEAFLIEGLNESIIQGGFFLFQDEVPDEDTVHDLVHQRLAAAFFNVGLYDIVEDSCRQSLDQSGDSVQAWMNLGRVYLHKGEYYKAEAAFKRALTGVSAKREEKMEALIWSHNYLGNCYDLLGHRDLAEVEYQAVVDMDNNYRGAVDFARKYLEHPFALDPEDPGR
jgi:hypothetical protein